MIVELLLLDEETVDFSFNKGCNLISNLKAKYAKISELGIEILFKASIIFF